MTFGVLLGGLRVAASAIARNKLRGFLTVFGILIGIAAVITVTALASGASQRVGGEIAGFAANALFINPQPVQTSGAKTKATGNLTEADAHAIAQGATSVSAVSPWLSGASQVVFGEKNVTTTVAGVALPYFPIRKYKVNKGDLWTESDELLKTKVCIIGATVATNLFGLTDPLGHTIRIGRAPFRVIGILESRGASAFGDDQDDRILMPIGSYRARVRPVKNQRVDLIMASAARAESTERAQGQIDAILRQRHRIGGGEPDFDITTQAEFQKTQEGISNVLSILFLSVAAVSLIVGGIGVMNIMLVSVTERTREIGIRMAIGAREGDILTQFLAEAIMLSALGGVLGLLCGTALTSALGSTLGWPMKPSASAVLTAASTSVLIGVFFGYLPARRAAKLDPIAAMREDA
jgi:putative ABC transport system permease protein